MLSSPPPPGSDTEIIALLEHLSDSWNDGDSCRYAEPFIDDAKYVTFFGAIMADREAIEVQHRELFADAGGKARLYYTEPPTIQFIRPDVALVLVAGGVTFQGNSEPDPDKCSTYLYVAVHETEGWRFASFQNTRRAPAPHLS